LPGHRITGATSSILHSGADRRDEPATMRVPWMMLLTAAALIVAQLVIFRNYLDGEHPLCMCRAWAAALAAVAAFLAMRWQQAYLWGVALGVVLPLHLVPELPAMTDATYLAEALGLVAFAAVVGGAYLTFAPRFHGWCWLLVGAMAIAGITLAWPLQPRVGLAGSILVLTGFALLAVRACRRRGRKDGSLPARINVALAIALAVLLPALGLALA